MCEWEMRLKQKIEYLYYSLNNIVDGLELLEHRDEECKQGVRIIDSLINNFVKETNNFRLGFLKPLCCESSAMCDLLYNYPSTTTFLYFDAESPWDFALKYEDKFNVKKMLKEFALNETLERLIEPFVPGSLVFCNSKFPFRGIIVEDIECRLRVLDIDTNCVKLVKTDSVYSLPYKFHTIPAQVVKCTLGKEFWLKDKWTNCLFETFENFLRKSTFTLCLVENLFYKLPALFQVNLVATNKSGSELNVNTWYNTVLVPFLEKLTQKIENPILTPCIKDPFWLVDQKILPKSIEDIKIQETPEEETSETFTSSKIQ